jgi:hypothetical protein
MTGAAVPPGPERLLDITTLAFTNSDATQWGHHTICSKSYAKPLGARASRNGSFS